MKTKELVEFQSEIVSNMNNEMEIKEMDEFFEKLNIKEYLNEEKEEEDEEQRIGRENPLNK